MDSHNDNKLIAVTTFVIFWKFFWHTLYRINVGVRMKFKILSIFLSVFTSEKSQLTFYLIGRVKSNSQIFSFYNMLKASYDIVINE